MTKTFKEKPTNIARNKKESETAVKCTTSWTYKQNGISKYRLSLHSANMVNYVCLMDKELLNACEIKTDKTAERERDN